MQSIDLFQIINSSNDNGNALYPSVLRTFPVFFLSLFVIDQTSFEDGRTFPLVFSLTKIVSVFCILVMFI